MSHVGKFLTFLAKVPNAKWSYHSISGAKSALSTFLTLPDGRPIGQHNKLCQLLRGIYNTRPPVARYSTIWDPDQVLTHLKSLPPNAELSLLNLSKKLVSLLLLTSGLRGHTISGILVSKLHLFADRFECQICPMFYKQKVAKRLPVAEVFKSFPGDKAICVRECLIEYLSRTEKLRSTDHLLTTTRKPYGKAARMTMSRWVSETLRDAGVDTAHFSTHSTRAASTSKAKQAGLPLETILKKAGWSGESTFRSYYDRPITKQLTNLVA